MSRLAPSIVFLVLVWCLSSVAAEPLHQRIDQLVDAAQVGPPAPQIDDAEFIRRVSLHLTGRVPSATEAQAFLDDKSPAKRAKLVDHLLASPAYAQHMTDVFSVMLMERRSNAADWLAFLKSSIEANKPWPEIVAAIISTDGVDPKNRGPLNFYTARNVEVNLLTREFGRLFFGMDLQCAQCHDHPLVDDYVQDDYYGVYAFLSRTYEFKPDKKKPGVLADKAEGDVSFKSVFTGNEGKTLPRLPGESEIPEPSFKKGEEYKVKADKKNKALRPVPHYSRRLKFAELVKQGENRALRRNIANRLWAHMMGRGLVEPVDLHHSDNPPSHPELMELLADEFAAINFDMRSFLKELALSKTYQRSVSLPSGLVMQAKLAADQLGAREQTQEKLAAAYEASVESIDQASDQLDAAKEQKAKLDAELKKANEAVAAAQKAHQPNEKQLVESQKQLTTKQSVSGPWSVAAAQASAAAKLLPDDKQLAQVAATLRAQSEKLLVEVTAMEKNLVTAQAKAKPTGDALATATKTASMVQASYGGAEKQVVDLSRKQASLEKNRRLQNVEANVAKQRVNTMRAFIEYGGKLEAADRLKTAADRAVAEARVPQQAADQARAAMAAAKRDMEGAQKAYDAAAIMLTVTKSKLAERPVVAKAVAEAVASLTAAQARLPNDAELNQVASQLKTKSVALTTEVNNLKKALPEQESAAKEMQERLASSLQTHSSAVTELTKAEQKLAPLAKQRDAVIAKSREAEEAHDQAYDELTKYWSQQFVVRPLQPLTPEQLAWSMMKVTGMWDRQRTASAAEINKKTPLKDEDKKEPAKIAARERQIDEATYNKLKGNVAQFVKLFAASAGQPQDDFFATFDQALFFANAGTLRSWIASGGLTQRLTKQDDPEQLAGDLFLTVLTRQPTSDEVSEVTKYLSARPKEKSKAVQELVLSLLTSTEFRFNH